MATANQLYEAGRFEEAAAHYQALVDAGVQQGTLFFNLGNTYFRLGDLGRAVLNYRRAQRLLPRDGDVAFNLELARAQARDQIEVENEGTLVHAGRSFIGWTTLNELAIVALTLWAILAGLIIAAILWRQRRRILLYVVAGAAILLSLSLCSIGIRFFDERGKPPAVIVAPEIAVRSGPGNDYLTEFTLHSGAEVRVGERRGEWVRITLPGSLQGWVPNAAVFELNTRE